MERQFLRPQFFICLAFIAAAVVACGGGGGGGGGSVPTTPSTPSVPTSVSTSAPLSASSTTVLSFGSVANAGTTSVSSATLTVPATGVSGVDLSATLSATAPSNVAAPQAHVASAVHRAAFGVQTIVAYFTLTFSSSVTMNASPAFSLTSPLVSGSGTWFAFFEDPNAASPTWSEIAQFTISGSTLTLASQPFGAPFTFQANKPYYIAIGSTVTPTSAPTATPTATAAPTATPTATAAPTATPTATPTPLNTAAIPLGSYSATTPAVGKVYSCASTFNGAGNNAGPWINLTNNTWNLSQKAVVSGSVTWNTGTNSFTQQNSTTFAVTTNDIPVGATTGVFPIAPTDPAHAYDQNPNSILTQSLSYFLPYAPTVASSPGCMNGGPIGVAINGVAIFDALDALGRDAAAYEVTDSCGGHPQSNGQYHYHTIDELVSCVADTPDANGHSSLLGYAGDGFGIYGNLGTGGVALTNASLDACHGHTHSVMFHGTMQTIYHYHVTKEFPYTVGCYKGTKAAGF